MTATPMLLLLPPPTMQQSHSVTTRASPAPGGVLREYTKLVSRKVVSFPPGAAEWLPEFPSVHLAGELRLS